MENGSHLPAFIGQYLISQAALLVEEAGHDLAQHNDARKAIIARRFCDTRLDNVAYDPDNPDPALTHASSVLEGTRLRPEDVQQPTGPK